MFAGTPAPTKSPVSAPLISKTNGIIILTAGSLVIFAVLVQITLKYREMNRGECVDGVCFELLTD